MYYKQAGGLASVGMFYILDEKQTCPRVCQSSRSLSLLSSIPLIDPLSSCLTTELKHVLEMGGREGVREGGEEKGREREQENRDWEKGGKSRAVFHYIFI